MKNHMITSFAITIANRRNIADCINLSKLSWPSWREENEKLGERHITDCILGKRCLIAIKDKEVIAFVAWGNLWNKIHIQDIYVKKTHRKEGIATQLMQKVMSICKKQGFKDIISDTDASNKCAIKFHLKFGFKKCGRIKKNRDGEDSYVFSMKI